MATLMDEIANISALANFTDAEKLAMIAKLGAATAPAAQTTSSAAASAPQLSTPPTPAQLAAGAAQDALIAQEDAGKGSVPISSITVGDLQWAAQALGLSFPSFLVAYTSDSHLTIDQTVNAYVAGGPQAANPNSPPVPSATIAAAVNAYKAGIK